MTTVLQEPQIIDPVPEAARSTPGLARTSRLRRLALFSSVWTFVGQGGSAVMRLIGNLVLARLLVPDAFGLAAIAGVMMMGLQMFSDFGLEPAIIRDQRGDEPRYLNTAWSIQVVRGLVLWLLACALTWPIMWFYGEPRFGVLVPVITLTVLITGFFSTNMYRAKRHMRLAQVTMLELIGQATALVTMIVWALISPTVWSLVAGGVCGAVMRLALSHIMLDGPVNRFAWDGNAVRSLLDFGKWVFLNSGLCFVSMHCDRLLVGRLLSMTQFGVFSVAYLLSQPAILANYHLCRSVLLPVLSRTYRDRSEQLADVYYQYRRYVDLLLLPALGVLLAVAPPLVNLLYDARYAAAGPMLQLFSIHAMLCCLVEPSQSCLLAMGFPRYMTLAYIARMVWVAAAIPLGWWWGGMMGVVWAVCLKESLVLLILWFYLHSLGTMRLAGEIRAVVMAIAGVAVGILLLIPFSVLAS